jgi:hypothetical protein
MFYHFFLINRAWCTKNLSLKEKSEQCILRTGAGKVTKADFESEVAISRAFFFLNMVHICGLF